MLKLQNYINGVLTPPASQHYFQSLNPATGKAHAEVPDSDARDVDMACVAAEAAFLKWRDLGHEKRAAYLIRLAQLIETHAARLAHAESVDNGKPLKLAQHVDIPRAAANFNFYGTGILHYASESHAMEGMALNYTLRQAVGVVGCISPWNLPLYLFSWKIAPALAAGCTVVAKPSEITPYTAFLLSELCIEAGFPPGVLNIVHGYGQRCGDAIVRHPLIKAISFTGGTATGKHIAAVAAPEFKKLSLELGGKNANIIFEDCDFEAMLKTTLLSSFSNQGQICLCGSRILIQRSIYSTFERAFIDAVNRLKVGDPLNAETQIGAIVSKSHFEKILSYIELAKTEGGTVLCGGSALKLDGACAQGLFIAPTVISGLSPGCRVNQEEIFGPVVTLIPFDTEAEALAIANGTPYGLASTLWTSDLKRAHRVAAALHTHIVWVNCWLLRDLRTPFGGVKGSGVGREGGFEALDFFTEPKNVCIKL